jgi:hypothetical protein
VDVQIDSSMTGGSVAVSVQCTLNARERNSLFLSGDVLVTLPSEGAVDLPEGVPLERTSMFLSELAGRQPGITRIFADAQSADRFAAEVREQLQAIDRQWSAP